MYMYDIELGEMDVELEVPADIRDARIVYGYLMNTFEELTEKQIERLNRDYRQDIQEQAQYMIATGETQVTKLLH